jgi:hypothetical protein
LRPTSYLSRPYEEKQTGDEPSRRALKDDDVTRATRYRCKVFSRHGSNLSTTRTRQDSGKRKRIRHQSVGPGQNSTTAVDEAEVNSRMLMEKQQDTGLLMLAGKQR